MTLQEVDIHDLIDSSWGLGDQINNLTRQKQMIDGEIAKRIKERKDAQTEKDGKEHDSRGASGD